MTMMRTLLVWLTIACAVPASESTPQASVRIDGKAASQALAIVSEFYERDMRIADDLLDAGLADQPLHLHLHQAELPQALQAVAHSLGCWWAATTDGILFTRSPALPAAGLSHVETYSSRLRQHHNLESVMTTFMQPWLGADHGIAYYSPLGRWTVTFDNRGQQRFMNIMKNLERPEPHIPALVNPNRQVRLETTITQDGTFQSWSELLTWLGSHGLTVSAHTSVRWPGSITISGGNSFDTLPLLLAAKGIPAQWIGDVLCLGGTLSPTEHPGQRARLAMIPVAHLGDESTVAALTADWCQAERDPWWTQPGAATLHLPEAGMLLVQVDRSALVRLLADIERFERRAILP